MFPEFPADLSTLSISELQALIDASTAWATAHAADEPTDENLASMRTVLAGFNRASAEMATREAEPVAPSPTMQEMAASMAAAPSSEPAVVADPAAAAGGGPAAAPAGGSLSSADLVTAVNTAVTASVTAVLTSMRAQQGEAITAAGDEGDLPLPDLDSLTTGIVRVRDRAPAAVQPIIPDLTIQASGDIPGFSSGQAMNGFEDIGRAFINKREAMGAVPLSSEGEKVPVAQVFSNLPEERRLRSGQQAENARKIEAATSLEALTAAGGRCVPAMPYYGLMVQAGAMRPVRDALTGFTMDRMAVTVLAPPTISSPGAQARTVTDGVTNSTTTVTSATAAFDSVGTRDEGALISGSGIPAGAYIVSVTNSTTVVISAAATLTASGVTLTITRRGAVGVITQAQDAAALNGTAAQLVAGSKPCIHVDCPAPTTVDLDAITWCLEFGNWTTKAFPEQMPAWLRLTMAVWARTAETALLDKMSALSTQITATGIVGALRSLIGQQVKAAAYFRNRNRLDDSVTLRCLMPRWVIDLGVCDIVHGSGYDASFIRDARAIVRDGLAEANVVPSYYVDSGTAKGQLFAPGGTAGAKHGATALVAFPSTVVWYLYPEGSFLFGDGGTLDFGIWRDSGLNKLNNYRMMAETWETVVGVGYEMLEVTSTVSANGTFAGPAYGSTTVSSPVAIPSTF